MSTLVQARQIDPGETRILAFDFGEKLADDQLTGTPTTTVTPDDAPSFTIPAPAQIAGRTINVKMTAGNAAAGRDFVVKVSCATVNGLVLHMTATIEVREGAN